jgi:sugar lactone lactonase YvrE
MDMLRIDSEMQGVRCVLDARAQLGESPVWSAEEQALYWVDILAPALHRLDPATGATRSWPLPQSIGSFGLCESGGAVLALRDGFYRFDFDSAELRYIGGPQVPDGVRFNDGKVSPEGRFFAGTMDEECLSRPLGALYRLDPDGRCSQVLDGLIVANGLAWSADGKRLCHSDSKGKFIRCYDYDPASGALSNPSVLARPDEKVGRPDGAAMDLEGYYWSAGISAGVLNRWAPDGRLERRIELPCACPTMPCFGGPELKTLYVTSLRHGLSAQRLTQWPLSGGIFALEVEVPGVPVARFKG